VTLTLDLHLPHWHHPMREAHFSPDRDYRYWLTSRWGTGPALMFVQLNPSTADEHHDDATSRRDARFAAGFGYDAMTLLNLYAFRTTDPKGLAMCDDPVGPENDGHLYAKAAEHDLIVLAWGRHAGTARARTVATRIWRVCQATGGAVAVLGWTLGGQPHHPLRLAKATPLQCLTARAHHDMLDVDPRWRWLLTDTSALEDAGGPTEVRP